MRTVTSKAGRLAFACLLIGTSIAAQKVTTNFDKNFDFATWKRCAWRQNHIVTRHGKQNDA
ncbi:MAG TPA: hypothetical protein VNO32_08285 [Candidatus Acidoferrum sp.]|jgi:hypothetical protein|nr:hypothetical protein [Candidatus Acidoferrum sp.]